MKKILPVAFAASLTFALSPMAQAYQTAEQSYLNYDNPVTESVNQPVQVADNYSNPQSKNTSQSDNQPPVEKKHDTEQQHNGFYINIGAGLSVADWAKTFNSEAFKDVQAINSFAGVSKSDAVLALRPSVGFDFMDHYGVELAYDHFGKSKWDSKDATANNDLGTGPVSASNIDQSAIELMGRLRSSINNFELYAMGGAVYVINKGFDVSNNSIAAAPYATQYKGKNYLTFGYGAGVNYYLPSFENLAVNMQWVNIIGKKKAAFTAANSSKASFDIPTRNTFLLGLTYKF